MDEAVEVDALKLNAWVKQHVADGADAAYQQIEGHLAATNRMAPAMLQIPGSARYLPMTAVVVFTGTRFLTAFQPDVGASPPGSDDPRATKKIRADAEPATPECSNGVDWNGTVMLKQSKVPLGQANKQVAVVDGTTPAADLATAGADLLAAVIAGDAPATISASQFLALIAAAQYFLAEDLLNPLGEYAEPVLDNLTTPLMGELLHAAAASTGAGSRAQAHRLLLRLFTFWWQRFERPPPSSPSAASSTASFKAALRALATGSSADCSLPGPSRLPQSFYGPTCCETGLPRGLGLLFAVLAALGCDSQSADEPHSKCAFAAGHLSRFIDDNGLYHLRTRADVRAALLDLLVLAVAQRRGVCPCAVDLLRSMVELSALRLPPPPSVSAIKTTPGSSTTNQMIEVGQNGTCAALLFLKTFQTTRSGSVIDIVRTDMYGSARGTKVSAEFTFAQVDQFGSSQKFDVGLTLYKKDTSQQKVELTAHLVVLPWTAEAAEAFEVTAQQWCASPAKFTSLEAAPGYVGRLDKDWGVGAGWPSFAACSSACWSSAGYSQEPGERFACGVLCATADFDLAP